MDFGAIIIPWYKRNRRDLPWRNTRDPYKIWLSEVILQQTRVQQGLAYYAAFISQYPDIQKLAGAKEADVLKLWQGLGYYSRARNLHSTAIFITKELKGTFPQSFTDLLKLKGVGNYTAAAIASFCYNEPQPVVDGNVYRVLSRIFGISTPIDSAAGKKEILDLAAELLDRKNPGIFNQAIMEFGAIQCVPQNPDCLNCPFLHTCHARRKDLINKLPVKARKTKVRDRYFHYLVIRKKGKVYVRQRTGDDIWKNLFDFPLIESKKALEPFALARTPEWKTIFRKNGVIIKGISGSTKHILTHQRLHIRFIELTTKNAPLNKNWQQVNESEIKKLAVPVPIQNYLEK